MRVSEEQTRNVGLLYIGLVWNLQQAVVTVKDEIHILIAEGYDCPIIQNKIVQKGVCFLIRVVDSFLIELQLRHSETTQYHER